MGSFLFCPKLLIEADTSFFCRIDANEPFWNNLESLPESHPQIEEQVQQGSPGLSHFETVAMQVSVNGTLYQGAGEYLKAQFSFEWCSSGVNGSVVELHPLPTPWSTKSHTVDFNLRTLPSEFWGTRRSWLLKTEIEKISVSWTISTSTTSGTCVCQTTHLHQDFHGSHWSDYSVCYHNCTAWQAPSHLPTRVWVELWIYGSPQTDGELRGVLSEEFGPAAARGATHRGVTWATLDPADQLGHPLQWQSRAFAPGKEQMSWYE